MKRRTIYYANVTIHHKHKDIVLEGVVYKERFDGMYYNLRELKKHGIKKAVEVKNVEVIKSLGLETKQAYIMEKAVHEAANTNKS